MIMRQKANEFIHKMQEEELTLALAESITSGLAAAKLSSCVGVSEVLTASLVCYTPEAKMELLGVKQKTIDRYTCESAEVTREMAQQLTKLVTADVYAAITGLASSDGSETKDKPVGTVFFCILIAERVHAFRKVFRGTPLEIKKKAALEVYKLILGLL